MPKPRPASRTSRASRAPRSRTVTPMLVVRDAARAIQFYVQAFGARERYRLSEPDGKVGHAELLIGNDLIMLADEYPDFGALGPHSVGGSPVKFRVEVDDVDAAMERAVAAGATVLRPARDEFYGDRTGMVVDPFGHQWFLAAQVEQVTPAELQRRFTAGLTAQ